MYLILALLLWHSFCCHVGINSHETTSRVCTFDDSIFFHNFIPLVADSLTTKEKLPSDSRKQVTQAGFVPLFDVMMKELMKQLRKKGFIVTPSLRTVSCGRIAWQQQHKAAGHMVVTFRRQRKRNARVQVSFSFVSNPGP